MLQEFIDIRGFEVSSAEILSSFGCSRITHDSRRLSLPSCSVRSNVLKLLGQ